MKKYQLLHIARGVAALLVAIGHLYYGFFSAPDLALATGSRAENLLAHANNILPLWLVIPRSQLWVNLFFLISGFVIEASLKNNSPLQFLIQRAFRIYPVFWFACLIQLLANFFIFKIPLPDGAMKEFLLLCSVNFLPVDWTLVIEANFYFFCGIVALSRAKAGARLGTAWLIFLAALVWRYKFQSELGGVWLQSLIEGNFYYILFMSFGSLIYAILHGEKKYQPHFKTALALHAFGFFLITELFIEHPTFGGRLHDWDRTALAGAMAIFLCCIFLEPLGRKIKSLEILGDISYPLYAIHLPIGWSLHVLLIDVLNCSPALSLIIVIPCVCAASYMVHIYIEKNSNSYGKQIARRISIGAPNEVVI